MAKIIEPGKAPGSPNPWPIGEVIKCESCGCKWEIETNNDYISLHSATGPGGKKRIRSTCPTCGRPCDKNDER